MNFKSMLSDVKRATDALAEAAGGLENQHLADIIKGASGRLHDAINHPQADDVDGRAVNLSGEPNPFPGAQ